MPAKTVKEVYQGYDGYTTIEFSDDSTRTYSVNDVATYVTDPLTGVVTGLVTPQGGSIPINGLRTTPLRVATFGDSTANCGTVQSPANQDMTKAISSAWQSGTVQLSTTVDKWALGMTYPLAYLVCNGGVSGDNTTAMLARDQAAASVTRKAITDVINSAPHVVLLRGGSINDIVTVTAGTLSATVASVFARHCQIIQRFMSANIPVVDEGIYGYSGVPTDLASTRSAILQLNALFASYASQYAGKVTFVSPLGVVSDSTGAYLANMSTDGTHLTTWGQYMMAAQEANALTTLFGMSANTRYQGVNNYANSLFANTGTKGYGTVATGIAVANTSCTLSNAQVQVINGKPFQTCDVTITGASSNAQLTMSYDPTATAVGMVAPMAISSGDIWGFEFDIYIAPLSGVLNLVSSGMNARVDTRDSIGSGRVLVDMLVPGLAATIYGPFTGHIAFPPLVYGDVSANLTTASVFSIIVSPSDTSGSYRIGVSQPRIVKLNQPVNTI